MPNTPKNSFSLWTTYDITPKLTVGGGAFYVDEVYGDAGNTVYVPSYTRYDAMASYKLTKNVDLQLNVQNLTDKTYYDKGLLGALRQPGGRSYGAVDHQLPLLKAVKVPAQKAHASDAWGFCV